MKITIALISLLLSLPSLSQSNFEKTQNNLINQVVEITKAQNKVMMKDSTLADIDQLFSMYTDDFIYIHEVYGGQYSREHLYKNTVKYLKSGGYNMIEDRYVIVNQIVGLNAVAVQRREYKGGLHLAVFEFKNDKVSKLTEYWK